MELEIVPARDEAERAGVAALAAEVLGAGGLVVHPTETVYGVGGDGSAANNRLIARVKRREPSRASSRVSVSCEGEATILTRPSRK